MVHRKFLLRLIDERAKSVNLSLLLTRDTGDHSIYIVGGERFAVPRHIEINEWTAMSIMKNLEDELGKGWWG
jgi:hypothetical protein